MVVLLGAFVMALIAIGFTLLAIVPLMFAVLGYAVFREPWAPRVREATPEGEALSALPVPLPEADSAQEPAPGAETEAERPRVRVAGRRQPL